MVASPSFVVLLKNSTLAMVPSVSVAVASTVMFAGSTTVRLFVGEVIVTCGGWLAVGEQLLIAL